MQTDFKKFSIFIECASNPVPKVSTLKKFMDLMHTMGYNALYLGTADTYEIAEEKYFGYMRGRYTKGEIHELDAYAKSKDIQLIPAIQTLAHLHFLPNYNDYKDFIDIGHVLLAEDERSYVLIERMFKTMAEFYSSRTINIGMDEAFFLGLGKYLERYGFKSKTEIMMRHLNRVATIAQKYGFDCEMWGDMFFKLIKDDDTQSASRVDEVRSQIPSNVKLVYWNYLTTDRDALDKTIKKYFKLTNNIGFAGGLWKWYGFAPDNGFSINMGNNAMDVCRDNNIDSFILTLWADNGGETSLFSILPSMFYYSEHIAGRANTIEQLDKAKFYKITGVSFDDFMLLDKLNKPHDKQYTWLNNKSYFYLYNDILLGTFDSLLSDNLGDAYSKVAKDILSVKGGEYSYIFKNLGLLAKVLSIKAEVGKRLKIAYDAKNMEELDSIANNDLTRLYKELDDFYNALRTQWDKENKSFGFEVQCIRLGGLKERILYVKNKINDFVSGKIPVIDEFEIERLPYNYDKDITEDTYIYLEYRTIVTHGFI